MMVGPRGRDVGETVEMDTGYMGVVGPWGVVCALAIIGAGRTRNTDVILPPGVMRLVGIIAGTG